MNDTEHSSTCPVLVFTRFAECVIEIANRMGCKKKKEAIQGCGN
jgi:hypothetical protein